MPRPSEARMEFDEEIQSGADFPILEAFGIGRLLDDKRWLFRDISLAIQPGERIALVGATGSGKTLLLRSLALLDPVDAGKVCWNGQIITSGLVPRFRSRVIYLHQRPPLFNGTVEENLRQPFALRIHRGKSFDRSQTLHRLSSVGHGEDFLAKPSRNLSGGERQLVALLRALQLGPVLLLLDEPTAALDANTSRAVEKLVQSWQAEAAPRRAFVWVSHQTDQIERITNRTLIMRAGQITEHR